MQQSRYDLEFLGRMLGLRPGVDYEARSEARRLGLIVHPPLNPMLPPIENAVAWHMGDPVANARARQRIGDLLAECEQVERTAANFFGSGGDEMGALIGALN